MLRTRILAALAVAAVMAGGQAAVGQGPIFSNAITDTNPSASNPFTAGQVVAPNLTVSGIGRGPGINPNAGGNRYNANSWNTTTLDPDAYFTFTLDANPGFDIDFTSFVYTGQASGTGPTSFAFRSNVDGFVANIGAPTASGATIDLSGAAFQNLPNPVEFRFFGFGASSAAGTFSINDFTFNGAVTPIPEPATILGASAGLLAVGRLVRRRVIGA